MKPGTLCAIVWPLVPHTSHEAGPSSSPPKPVQKGSLRATINEALAAAAAAGAETAIDSDGLESVRRRRDRSSGAGGGDNHDGGTGTTKRKMRQVLVDDNDDEYVSDNGENCTQPSVRGRHATKGASTRQANESFAFTGDDATMSLDDIKRQMGKNPRQLERSRSALDDEMRVVSGARKRLRGNEARNKTSGSSALDEQHGDDGVFKKRRRQEDDTMSERDGTGGEADKFDGSAVRHVIFL